MLKNEPNNPKDIEESAFCLAYLNKKEARLYFDIFINLNPQKVKRYYNRAIYFINYKIKEDYCEDLKKVIDLKFNQARAIFIKKCQQVSK